MDWQWNSNGKRFRVSEFENTKKKRIGSVDVPMEDECASYKLYLQKIQNRLDREVMIYKQQIYENSYLMCCKKKHSFN